LRFFLRYVIDTPTARLYGRVQEGIPMTYIGKHNEDALNEGAHDDLHDLVRLIAPFDTPLLDAIGGPRGVAMSTRHEWDGGDNYTTIFVERVSVPVECEYDVERNFDYQVIKHLRELLRSLERCVVHGTDGGRRRMRGLLDFVGRARCAADTGLDDALIREAYRDSGANAIVCTGAVKRQLSKMVNAAKRAVMESGSLRNLVDVYEIGDESLQIILCKHVPEGSALLVDLNALDVPALQGRSFQLRDLAVDADGHKNAATIAGEYTLECRRAAVLINNIRTVVSSEASR
jgi:hypothetical protein